MKQDTALAPDARSIANYVLGHYSNLALTNMSIQKLVFFSHGLCLAITEQPLVRNGFEAWDHGPVVPALYDSFKSFRAAPISKLAVWFDWDTDQFIEVPSELTDLHIRIVKIVVDVYGRLNGLALSDLTHQADTPWYAVRHPPRGTLFLNNRIPDELIRHYFKTTTQEIHRRALGTCINLLLLNNK